ncbi:MAG: HesB/YadR/YfhF family protein [Neobacillus sp.]
MKIQISSNAAAWYKQELGLNTGDFVRFYARYGGYSTVQSGFSLGIAVDEPMELAVKTVEDGITFYIEEKDLWYFDEHDLIIELDSKRQEPAIQYQKNL